MTENHNEYVSLDIAKLLKKAGFDWAVEDYYGHNFLNHTINFANHNAVGDEFSAPTLAVAQRWLREIKGVQVSTTNECMGDGTPCSWGVFFDSGKFDDSECVNLVFDSYEEALEFGIMECLLQIIEE